MRLLDDLSRSLTREQRPAFELARRAIERAKIPPLDRVTTPAELHRALRDLSNTDPLVPAAYDDLGLRSLALGRDLGADEGSYARLFSLDATTLDALRDAEVLELNGGASFFAAEASALFGMRVTRLEARPERVTRCLEEARRDGDHRSPSWLDATLARYVIQTLWTERYERLRGRPSPLLARCVESISATVEAWPSTLRATVEGDVTAMPELADGRFALVLAAPWTLHLQRRPKEVKGPRRAALEEMLRVTREDGEVRYYYGHLDDAAQSARRDAPEPPSQKALGEWFADSGCNVREIIHGGSGLTVLKVGAAATKTKAKARAKGVKE